MIQQAMFVEEARPVVIEEHCGDKSFNLVSGC